MCITQVQHTTPFVNLSMPVSEYLYINNTYLVNFPAFIHTAIYCILQNKSVSQCEYFHILCSPWYGWWTLTLPINPQVCKMSKVAYFNHNYTCQWNKYLIAYQTKETKKKKLLMIWILSASWRKVWSKAVLCSLCDLVFLVAVKISLH